MGGIKEAWNGVSTVWDTIKEAAGDKGLASVPLGVAHFGQNIGRKIGVKVGRLFAYDTADDMIYVSEGQTTLDGSLFEELYPDGSVDYESREGNDGVDHKFMKVNADYETEMHSGWVQSAHTKDYNVLSNQERAIYELTLASKKFAYSCINNLQDENANGSLSDERQTALDDNMNEYFSKLEHYKELCDKNNLDFNTVLLGASVELQTECADYNNNYVVNGMSKAVTNAAHLALAKCGKNYGFEDVLCPALSGQVSYEDTVSLDDVPDEAKTRVRVLLDNLSNALHNFHPIKGIKNFFTGTKDVVVDTAKDYTEGLDAAYDQTMLDGVETRKDIGEGIKSLEDNLENAGEKAMNGVNDIADTAGEVYDRARDGISDEDKEYYKDTAFNITDKIKDFAGKALNTVNDMADSFKEQHDRSREGFDDMIDGWAGESENDEPEISD